MDILNRKLFQNRDARNKLRQQGGILSSSPELAQTVARFANGGPTELQIPSVRRAIQEGGMSYPSYRMMSGSQKRELGYPESDIGGQWAFRRLGVGLGLVDPETRFTPSGLPIQVAKNISRGEALIPDPMQDVEVSQTINLEDPTAAMRERWEEFYDPEGFAVKKKAELELEQAVKKKRTADAAAEVARMEDINILPEERERAVDDEGKLIEPEDVPTPEPDPDPKPDPDPDRDPVFDFDAKYAENKARFESILGAEEKRDPEKQRMANLAAFGLALLASDSPFIGQAIGQAGSAVLKANEKRKSQEREDLRKLKLAALQATIEQEKEVTAAAARAAEKENEYNQKVQLEILKSGLRVKEGGGISPLDPFAESVLDQAGVILDNGMASTYDEAIRKAYKRVSMLPGYSEMKLPDVDKLLIDPTIQKSVNTLKERKTPLETIKKELIAKYPGIDPSLYGL